jgi:hypothetical protein
VRCGKDLATKSRRSAQVSAWVYRTRVSWSAVPARHG